MGVKIYFCWLLALQYFFLFLACALDFFLLDEPICSFIYLGRGDARSLTKQDEHYSLQPLCISKAGAVTTGLRRITCQGMSHENCRLLLLFFRIARCGIHIKMQRHILVKCSFFSCFCLNVFVFLLSFHLESK